MTSPTRATRLPLVRIFRHPAVRLDQLHAAVWDLLMAWRAGAASSSPTRHDLMPASRARADHPPAHHDRAAAALVARRPAVRELSCLTTLIVGAGLRGRAAAAWLAAAPCLNAYGRPRPACAPTLVRLLASDGARPPIGRPLAQHAAPMCWTSRREPVPIALPASCS